MIFTRADYKNMKMLKEKLGSWSDTYDYLDIKPRTARYMRRRFREDNIQEYEMKTDNAEMIEKRLDFLVDKDVQELRETKPARKLSSNQKTLDKYNISDDTGIPSLSYEDYTKYDEDKESWVAWDYSNLPTGKKISKGKSRQIRGASLNQIRKINKAKHFAKQKGINPEQAYKMANEWQKKYNNNKNIFDDVAFKDSKGRWHWGKNGAGKSGDYAGKEDVIKTFKARFGIDPTEDNQEYYEMIARYTDQVFALRPSP